jgi:hypothetical protein
MPGLLDLLQADTKQGMIFHIFCSFLVLLIIICVIIVLTNTTKVPANPNGWSTVDYDANQVNRKSFAEYLATNSIPDSTPMVNFSVATANFGGIFTEDMALMSPWVGSVSPEAARLQVEAGARAIVLDIWPNPADPASPVVCAMVDTTEWSTANRWRNSWGLGAGVGRYSNWQKLTRNTAPVGDVLQSAITAAFNGSPGNQNGDPFFVILKLHGAMTLDYLNLLGTTVKNAIGAYAMPSPWPGTLNQKMLCTAKVSEFMGQAFVIVIPDIETGYNILPNTSTYSSFTTQFLTTTLGEVTNALEQAPNTILFDPGSVDTISVPSTANCVLGGPQLTLAGAGFCVVQPSIGGQTTDNQKLFSQNSFQTCLQSGAQFVAMNLFSRNTGDTQMQQWFDPKYYGTYSFKKGV